MGLPVSDQIKYWGIATLVFFVLLWFLGGIILPFIVGGAIAYFLDPIADRMERAGLSRTAATSIISIIALLAFVLAALIIIPTLVQQSVALVNAAPDILTQLQSFLGERFPEVARCAKHGAPDARRPGRNDPRSRWRTGQRAAELGAFGDFGGRLHRRRAGRGVLHAARTGTSWSGTSTSGCPAITHPRSAGWRRKSTPFWPASCGAS